MSLWYPNFIEPTILSGVYIVKMCIYESQTKYNISTKQCGEDFELLFGSLSESCVDIFKAYIMSQRGWVLKEVTKN